MAEMRWEIHEAFPELLYVNLSSRLEQTCTLSGPVLDLFLHFWHGRQGNWGSREAVHESLIRAEPGLRMVANMYLQYMLLALGKDEQSRFHIHLMFYTPQKNVFWVFSQPQKNWGQSLEFLWILYKSDGHIGLKRNFHQKRSHRSNCTRTLRMLHWMRGVMVSEPFVQGLMWLVYKQYTLSGYAATRGKGLSSPAMTMKKEYEVVHTLWLKLCKMYLGKG